MGVLKKGLCGVDRYDGERQVTQPMSPLVKATVNVSYFNTLSFRGYHYGCQKFIPLETLCIRKDRGTKVSKSATFTVALTNGDIGCVTLRSAYLLYLSTKIYGNVHIHTYNNTIQTCKVKLLVNYNIILNICSYTIILYEFEVSLFPSQSRCFEKGLKNTQIL